jgi:hypothetical protein
MIMSQNYEAETKRKTQFENAVRIFMFYCSIIAEFSFNCSSVEIQSILSTHWLLYV